MRVATRVLAVVAGLLIVLLPAGARAHTGLESSTPADGDTVEGPLRSIVLEFTGTPTAIDGGIVVAAADGCIAAMDIDRYLKNRKKVRVDWIHE